MSKATGKAHHPHDSSRPEPKAVKEAIERGDIAALRMALTIRQVRFAEEYIVDFNATAAAIRAGYSPKYADRQAYILLNHEGVRYLINDLCASKEAKIVSVNPDYVIQKVTEIVTKEGSKDSDKLRGLELLARHLGMFIDRTEITGKDGEAIEINNRKIEEEASHFTNMMKQLRDRQKKETVEVI